MNKYTHPYTRGVFCSLGSRAELSTRISVRNSIGQKFLLKVIPHSSIFLFPKSVRNSIVPAAHGRIGRFSGSEVYSAIFSIESEINFHALHLPKISYPQATNFGKFIYDTPAFEYLFIPLLFLVLNLEQDRIVPKEKRKCAVARTGTGLF